MNKRIGVFTAAVVALGLTVWLGAAGFADDALKLRHKRVGAGPRGLNKKTKLLLQAVVGLAVGTRRGKFRGVRGSCQGRKKNDFEDYSVLSIWELRSISPGQASEYPKTSSQSC